MPNIQGTLSLLKSLLSFNTISAESNMQLITWVHELLVDAGATVTLIRNVEGSKANLFATTGPKDQPGFMLSGHTDVVPVEGQHWSVPPFKMTERDDKIFGRGSADMKGFIACAMNAFLNATKVELVTPLHLALSYDEEIGCVGVHSMLDMLDQSPIKPLMCLVGEPTMLDVAIGHKGKTACHVHCTGRAGHSALAPQALNAIHLASDLIQSIRQIQNQIAHTGKLDSDYEVPYTTLHVSNISGGIALNIVPDYCQFDMEIRHLAEDDPEQLLNVVRKQADLIVTTARKQASEAGIELEVFNTYPGLDTNADSAVVTFVRSLQQSNRLKKVAFGTEAGLFSNRLGVPTVVCGPGSMDQGHKADEFIAVDQLNKCDDLLANLIKHLAQGI